MEIMVVKEFTFDCAHYLPFYTGKCGNLHGHTYKLQVGFAGEPNQATGMVMDFVDLAREIDNVLQDLDHQCLNNITNIIGFPSHLPTAENMVVWFVEYFLRNYGNNDMRLALVRLWETPTSYAEWTGEK